MSRLYNYNKLFFPAAPSSLPDLHPEGPRGPLLADGGPGVPAGGRAGAADGEGQSQLQPAAPEQASQHHCGGHGGLPLLHHPGLGPPP